MKTAGKVAGARIGIIHPAQPRTRTGNRVTALRWACHLRNLGARVFVAREYDGRDCDVLVVLHAVKSRAAVDRWLSEAGDRPLVVGLAGTDVYATLKEDPGAMRALERADRIVALQPRAAEELPERLRDRVRVIHQSAPPRADVEPPARGSFDVLVLAHLRDVKDPLRTAYATRLLPRESRVYVLHFGAVLDHELGARAAEESDENPRYNFAGEIPHGLALQVLARARLLVLTSKLEGGANVVTEAIAAGVPVLSTEIEGSIGILGPDYPGYFPVGDEAALADLLQRAETDPAFLDELRDACAARAELASPERERAAWAELLEEVL